MGNLLRSCIGVQEDQRVNPWKVFGLGVLLKSHYADGTDLSHTRCRPPLRHGWRRHGSPATGQRLDAKPPTRGDYLRRMSAAHTDPSLVAAVTLC